MKNAILSTLSLIFITTYLSAQSVTLVVNFDNYPNEVGWKINNSSGTSIVNIVPGASNAFPSAGSMTFNYTLAAGTYTFYMVDTYGDGLQGAVTGNFTLSYNGQTLASG